MTGRSRLKMNETFLYALYVHTEVNNKKLILNDLYGFTRISDAHRLS